MSLEHFSLANKRVLITGASGLLGLQHARAIIQAGGSPILIDIDTTKANQFKSEMKKNLNQEIDVYKVDITNENEIIQLEDLLIDKPLHGIINNACMNPKVTPNGVFESKTRLEEFSLQNWNAEIGVGLTGSFLITKHIGKILSRNIEGGSIVNISSDLGLVAPDQRLYSNLSPSHQDSQVKPVTYSVIKSGIIGLTKYTATYWADKNVRCNALCPGGVYTDQSEEFISKISKLIPLSRMARVDEYQGSIVYLLSEASSYMTGSILSVDGGRTAW
tara:strand:+ start:799 stop:1623 length:825 start_codon:yes stop_codon:yes gene_type:complete